MKTSDAERLRKVQTLYDRATNPGEKAAALEAMNRIRETAERWKDEIFKVLVENGFWKYMSTQNKTSFLRTFKEEYVEVVERNPGGEWTYNTSYGKFHGSDSESLLARLNQRKGS